MAGKMFIGNKAVTPVIIKGGSPEPEEGVIGKLIVKEINGKQKFCIENVSVKGVTRAEFRSISFKKNSVHTGIEILGDVVFEDLEYIDETGLYDSFSGNSHLKSVSFPKLKTIEDEGLYFGFVSCEGLKEIRFPLLETVNGWDGLNNFVQGTYGLDIYFNSLKNIDDIEYMLYGIRGATNVHFASNMEQTVSQLWGYPTFKGDPSLVTLSFDLPPTE